jgi:hypothetical protein
VDDILAARAAKKHLQILAVGFLSGQRNNKNVAIAEMEKNVMPNRVLNLIQDLTISASIGINKLRDPETSSG